MVGLRNLKKDVYEENGELKYEDEKTFAETRDMTEYNLLKPIFCDGEMIADVSLNEIRNKLHGGSF